MFKYKSWHLYIYMYIHKHTLLFWGFLFVCLFVFSCLLLVVWNKSQVVGVTNLYQFWGGFPSTKETLLRSCLEYV